MCTNCSAALDGSGSSISVRLKLDFPDDLFAVMPVYFLSNTALCCFHELFNKGINVRLSRIAIVALALAIIGVQIHQCAARYFGHVIY